MAKIELEISESAMERLREITKGTNGSVAATASRIVEDQLASQTAPRSILGQFSAEADLMDEITNEAMIEREAQWNRLIHG